MPDTCFTSNLDKAGQCCHLTRFPVTCRSWEECGKVCIRSQCAKVSKRNYHVQHAHLGRSLCGNPGRIHGVRDRKTKQIVTCDAGWGQTCPAAAAPPWHPACRPHGFLGGPGAWGAALLPACPPLHRLALLPLHLLTPPTNTLHFVSHVHQRLLMHAQWSLP